MAETTSPAQRKLTAASRMKPVSRVGDTIFAGASSVIAIALAIIVILMFVFLMKTAAPTLLANTDNFFTSRAWTTDQNPPAFGIQALLWTTVISSLLALLIAVPLSVGIALFITQLAPRKLASPVAFVGSSEIVNGLRGAIITTLGWIPIFSEDSSWSSATGTVYLASLVLAIMILPIITAVSRDVMAQTPHDQVEAALALGSTRWEVIKLAVLPHSRSGIISGSMLGLGRALGETLAVTLILQTMSPMALKQNLNLSIFVGGETFASKIAGNFSEAISDPTSLGALVASALALFVITFVVNATARLIAAKGVKR